MVETVSDISSNSAILYYDCPLGAATIYFIMQIPKSIPIDKHSILLHIHLFVHKFLPSCLLLKRDPRIDQVKISTNFKHKKVDFCGNGLLNSRLCRRDSDINGYRSLL